MSDVVLEKLAAAIAGVSAAESDLAALLRALVTAPRAEKKMISLALETALSRLNVARDVLLDLQKVAAER